MTVYKNDYKAPVVDVPPNVHLETKAEDYDLNFCLPVKVLRSDRLELRPFIVRFCGTPIQQLIPALRTCPAVPRWCRLELGANPVPGLQEQLGDYQRRL